MSWVAAAVRPIRPRPSLYCAAAGLRAKAFWKLVAAAFPEYREARAWLRAAEYLLASG